MPCRDSLENLEDAFHACPLHLHRGRLAHVSNVSCGSGGVLVGNPAAKNKKGATVLQTGALASQKEGSSLIPCTTACERCVIAEADPVVNLDPHHFGVRFTDLKGSHLKANGVFPAGKDAIVYVHNPVLIIF